MAALSLPGQVARTRRFTRGAPGHFTVAPDGATVLFTRSRAGDDPVACLWALDLGSGTERLLADPAELLGEERARAGAGIDAYATDGAAGLVACTLAGELWTVDVAGGRARRLPAEGPVADPFPDPAGRRIAYVRGGALRVIEADGTGDHAIAAPDGPEVRFGTAEHTGAASPGGPRGHWWAPDGTRLLVARTDSARVEPWYDNVHPANTLRLSSALLAAGRPHEVLLLPGTGHQAIGSPITESLLLHQARFLRRHLGVGHPRM